MGNKIILSLIILIAVGGIILMKSPDKSASEVLDQGDPTEVISRNGLHWHSTLLIYVKGEKMEIPANIGLGAVHNPIHTHVEDAPAGIIHLEFSGLVRNSNTRLDEFFKAWNKTSERLART